MKKSFKKAIACLLAVLMVAFSVPFTALAAPGDYNPDIDVVFGTLFDQGSGVVDGENMWFPAGHGTSTTTVDFGYAGPNNVPVTIKNGQLVLEASSTVDFATTLMEDPDMALTEDYVLQNGDYFTVTVIAHNIDNIFALYSQLTWNKEAIAPAGLWQYKGNKKMATTTYQWGTIDEMEAKAAADQYYKSHTALLGGTAPLYDLSSGTIYAPAVNYDTGTGAVDDQSAINSDYLQVQVLQADGGDVSTIPSDYAFAGMQTNPYTGEYDGYYENNHNVILETYIFKVIDNTKPLNFDVYDKENNLTNYKYENGKYIAMGESTSPADYVTYSYNTYTGAYDAGASDPTKTENAGSRHMTFQGQQYGGGEVTPTEYTVTFKDASGTEISSVTGEEGDAVTVPDLTSYAKAADAAGHYSTFWAVEGTTASVTPAATIGTEDITYQVTYSDAIAHDYTGQAQYDVVAASCTAGGSYKVDCKDCGWTLNGTTEATGHTLTPHAAAAATCTEDGNSAYWSCSVCNKYFSDAAGENEIAENSWVIAASHQDVQHVAAVAPTTTENGNIEYWYCAACNKYFSDAALTNEITQAETVIEATGYTYAYDHMEFAEAEGVVTAKAIYVAAEDSTKTKEYEAECSITSTVPATCTATGTATWTATYDGNSDTYAQTLDMIAHTLTETPAAPADCVNAGNSAYYTCTECNKFFSDAAGENEIEANSWVIPALGHNLVETPAQDPTCEGEGNTAYYTCTRCNKYFSDAAGENEIAENSWVLAPINHDYSAWVYDGADAKTHTKTCSHANCEHDTVTEACSFDEGVVTTEPTATTEGVKTYTCSVCGGTYTETIAKKATITIAKADLGTVTSKIADLNTTGASVSAKLDFGASYAVTAVPAEGAKFVGWQIGSKIVSDKATYSSVAYSDVTLIPVFIETETTDEFTVIFYDLYGNVVDTFKGNADAWAAYEYPEAPARSGYTFKEWDTEKDAITSSATVWAKYDKAATAGAYTITTTADLTLPAGVENGSIPYNTQVTVSKEGATAWKVGDTIVAYGPEYTFYVGADMEIVPVTDAVAEEATVTIVGANKVSDTKYSFVANMAVPSGKVVERGFVYGKNLAAADLEITNEGKAGSLSDSATVKVLRMDVTSSDQFALAYGLSVKPGRRVAAVRAFIVMSDGTVKYSDAFSFDYAAGAQVENLTD